MADFSDDIIQKVWENGITVDGADPDEWRKDFCNAWIHRNEYGDETDYAWSIDHVYPEKKGGPDDLVNLRPMHVKNNSSKSDSYPTYSCALTSKGKENVPTNKTKTVHEELRRKLRELGFD